MQADATILENWTKDPYTGSEYITYAWEGGKIAYIRPTTLLRVKARARIGQIVTLDQLRLRIVGLDESWCFIYAMRDGWRARAYAAWYPVARFFRRFYSHLMATAWIWGLAEYEQGTIATWRDLKIVRWARGKWQSSK